MAKIEEESEKPVHFEPGPPAEAEVEETSETSEQPKNSEKSQHFRHWHRFTGWYGTHKKWSIPGSILMVLIILAAVPWTRYKASGLVLKKDFTVHIIDSTANTPVSGATVSFGSVSATTDADGQASLRHIKVGNGQITITKKYYQDKTASVLVPVLKEKNIPSVALVATGRQVKISVTNLINKKALAGVDIEVAGTNAKTDNSGNALLVLPANSSSQKAKLSLDGYNNANATVLVSNSSVKQNDYQLTPAGKIYFLSNQTGTLNVMKANLDGTSPEVAVAGTGSEDTSSTSLTQSPDGKYVALTAIRNIADQTPQLYILSAADDKLLQVDSGDAVFQVYGWTGDNLIYTSVRNDLPTWQQGLSKLKSYDANSGNTTLLDQSAGSDATNNINEIYNQVAVSGGQVVFSKFWVSNVDTAGDDSAFAGKQNSVQIIDADGQNHKTVATYDAVDSLQVVQHSPDSFYIWDQPSTGINQNFFDYTTGDLPKAVTITSTQFYSSQTNYYFSPSGNLTLWSESRDGKNVIMVGDQNGSGSSTIASLDDDIPYGWYSDQYVLLSKDNDELYIMGVKGGTPIKVTDYQSSNYGYGYGGR